MAEYGVKRRSEPEHPKVDLVVVHGLNGDALATWTHATSKRNWVTDDDFLKPIRTDARFMTFGYNANSFSDTVTSRIINHATDLLEGLRSKRLKDPHRPIIFVAHSLGGLVVKSALTNAQLHPDYQSIVQATHGIIFLGTPHHGSGYAGALMIAERLVSWAKLKNSSATRLTQELKLFSDTICDLNQSFLHTGMHFPMLSFYEQMPTRLPNGSALIVEEGSAKMNHPNEKAVSAPCTHEQICKFADPADNRLEIFEEKLQELVDQAVAVMEKRAAKPVEAPAEASLEERLTALGAPPQAFPTPNPPIRRVDSYPWRDEPQPDELDRRERYVDKAWQDAELPTGRRDLRAPYQVWSEPEQAAYLKSLAVWNRQQDGSGVAPAQTGTCQWIYDNPVFRAWCDDVGPRLLFVLGPSGCGKSVLAKALQRTLAAEREPRPARADDDAAANAPARAPRPPTVVGFFCKGMDGKQDDPPILQYFLHGLLEARRRRFRHLPIRFKLKRHQTPADSVDEAWNLLDDLVEVPAGDDLVLMIDGLDECKPTFITAFLTQLTQRFGGATHRRVKVLITCRRSEEIDWFAFQQAVIDIDEHLTSVNQDIARYVQLELGKIADFRKYPTALRDRAIAFLQEKADGMFLWAYFVLDELRKLDRPTTDSVIDTISSSPREIAGYYLRCLQRIADTPGDDTRRVLMMIAFAARPLATKELAEALAIDPRVTSKSAMAVTFDTDNLVLRYAPLVKVSHGIADLVHHSLKEFLSALGHKPGNRRAVPLFPFQRAECHAEMAALCLRYLLLDDFRHHPPNPLPGSALYETDFPFLSYAIQYWAPHVQAAGALSATNRSLLSRFLGPGSASFDTWDYLFIARQGVRRDEVTAAPTPVLNTICRFGLTQFLDETALAGLYRAREHESFVDAARRRLGVAAAAWRQHLGLVRAPRLVAHLDDRDLIGDTALHEAARNDHLAVVRTLLQLGADEHARNLRAQTPLHCACDGGSLDVVQELLRVDARVGQILNSRSTGGFTPMTQALYSGHEDLAAILLIIGARIDVVTRVGWWPLQIAASKGFANWIALCHAKYGAELDLDRPDKSGYTPLHYAAEGGFPETIRTLVQLGADRECPIADEGASGWTPLLVATQGGNLAAVEALLALSADPNATTSAGMTPLHIAGEAGFDEVARGLLAVHADPNRLNKAGETPLYLAATPGNVSTMAGLLEAGARPGLGGKESCILPLHMAAFNGHLAAVRLLLEYDADPAVTTNFGWTALFAAAIKGHVDIMSALVGGGADVTHEASDGADAFYEAVKARQAPAAHWLLAHGARPFGTVDGGWTPLHRAADTGQAGLVTAIVAQGEDVDVETGLGWTPLLLACGNGHLDAARALLEHGADATGATHLNYSTVHAAVGGGNLALVQELVDRLRRASTDGAGLMPATATATDAVLDRTDADGITPLHKAAAGPHLAIVEYLLAQGANPNAESATDRFIPLHNAAGTGTPAIIARLAQCSDVNRRTRTGYAPLHYACDAGRADLVDALLVAGADGTGPSTIWAKTPLHVAAQEGRVDVIRRLVGHGAPIDALDAMHCTPLRYAVRTSSAMAVVALIGLGAEGDVRDLFGRDCLQDAPRHRMLVRAPPRDDRRRDPRWPVLVRAVVHLAHQLRIVWALDDGRFGELARALVLCDDDENVRVVHARYFRRIGAGQIEGFFMCDNHAPTLRIEGTMYKCRVCVDLDLCEPCMRRYDDGARMGPNICRGHAFLASQLDGSKKSVVEMPSAEDEGADELMRWLAMIEAKYTALARDAAVDEVASCAPPPSYPSRDNAFFDRLQLFRLRTGPRDGPAVLWAGFWAGRPLNMPYRITRGLARSATATATAITDDESRQTDDRDDDDDAVDDAVDDDVDDGDVEVD